MKTHKVATTYVAYKFYEQLICFKIISQYWHLWLTHISRAIIRHYGQSSGRLWAVIIGIDSRRKQHVKAGFGVDPVSYPANTEKPVCECTRKVLGSYLPPQLNVCRNHNCCLIK